jgi:hypothetical protein
MVILACVHEYAIHESAIADESFICIIHTIVRFYIDNSNNIHRAY